MKIILFSSNENKIKECKKIFNNISKYTNFISEFSVIESGETFVQNANIKLMSLVDKLDSKILKKYILMAEDSGICIKELDNKPGIYSSRYANIKNIKLKEEINKAKEANSNDNINKVIENLHNKGKKDSKAFFISCVNVYIQGKIYTTHGFLHGKVVDYKEGNNGFGYDPIFIPNGYNKSLGVLKDEIKNKISHRLKALELMKILLK